MTSGSVRIKIIIPNSVSADVAADCLTPEEKSRAARFHFPRDATHWAACRAALRQILGEEIGMKPVEVPLIFSEFGKPLLAPPFDSIHFNLSHCPDLAIVALGNDGPLGVDIESTSRASELLGCENSFCHPEEIRSLSADPDARAVQLLRIWTAKEALLKALGTGLSQPPEEVQIVFGELNAVASSSQSLAGIEQQLIWGLENPVFNGYRVAVSAPSCSTTIQITHF